MIDVSDLLHDPDFATVFDVVRRTAAVGTNGRNATTPIALYAVVGVVTGGSSGALKRAAEYGASSRAITVHTTTRLYDTTDGRLPDLIAWRGTTYIVDRVADYGEFGQGFWSAECIAYTPVQGEPPA